VFECRVGEPIDGSGKRIDGFGKRINVFGKRIKGFGKRINGIRMLIGRAVKVCNSFPDALPLLASFGSEIR
jgi:hypothetical protein